MKPGAVALIVTALALLAGCKTAAEYTAEEAPYWSHPEATPEQFAAERLRQGEHPTFADRLDSCDERIGAQLRALLDQLALHRVGWRAVCDEVLVQLGAEPQCLRSRSHAYLLWARIWSCIAMAFSSSASGIIPFFW